MIPDGNIRGDLLSVGIATLNRRLNEEDALSGNVAAGCFRQPLHLRDKC